MGYREGSAPGHSWRRVAPLGLAGVLLLMGCQGRGYYVPPAGGAGGQSSSLPSGGAAGSGGSGEPWTELVELELPAVALDQPVEVTVPPGTLGLTAVVFSPTALGRVGFAQVRAPNGELIIGGFDGSDGYHLEGVRWEFSWFGTTVAAVPQSDASSAMPVLPGAWQLTFGDPHGAEEAQQLRVWLRQSSDGQFHGGTIDVNLLVVPGAASLSYLHEVVAEAFDGDYAGLELGTVTDYELGPEHGVIDWPNAFAAFEQTAVATTTPALSILVVLDLVGTLQDAAGLAAGIPGLGVLPGSHSSGVIWLPLMDQALDVHILRHEAGHLAGLFHTTELEQPWADALADTPVCSNVEGLMYDCPDAGNVMFPVAGWGSHSFTALQERVIVGSTLWRDPPAGLGAGDGAAGQAVAPPSARGRGDHARRPGRRRWGSAPAWPRSGDDLPDHAARLLASHWCRQGGVDHYELLRRLGVTAAQLLAIGQAAGAPAFVRRRALSGAGRLAPDAAVLPPLERLARDVSEPRAVRLGALDGLYRGSRRLLPRAAARRVLLPLSAAADPVVAQLAERLLQRLP